jgi:hypothetical protein
MLEVEVVVCCGPSSPPRSASSLANVGQLDARHVSSTPPPRDYKADIRTVVHDQAFLLHIQGLSDKLRP